MKCYTYTQQAVLAHYQEDITNLCVDSPQAHHHCQWVRANLGYWPGCICVGYIWSCQVSIGCALIGNIVSQFLLYYTSYLVA